MEKALSLTSSLTEQQLLLHKIEQCRNDECDPR